jgi:hypothetical protein
MEYKNLEWVPGDPITKEMLSVPPEDYPTWQKTWGDSYCVENVFDDDELIWLEDLMYRNHRSRRVKKNGTLHFNVDNRLIQDKFFDKLKIVIPELENTEIWEGNFLITTTPYNIHIDTGNHHVMNSASYVPGKQFIIPLWYCHVSKNTDDPDHGTAIFKNRFIMYGTNFAKGDAKYDTNVFYTVRDYKDLVCYKKDGSVWDVDWSKRTIDDETYNRYFDHFKREWLDGFELEAVYQWKRGSIIVFDRSQAHTGINFRKNKVTMKCGLSMMTTVKR